MMKGRDISFSLSTLGHRLMSVPMLVILIPFTLGILLYDNYALPLIVVLVALLITCITAWLLHRRTLSLGYATLALILFGYTMAELRAPRPTTPYNEVVEMVIRVESQPKAKDGYRRAEGRIEAWTNESGSHKADDRVVLWLRTDSVDYGDRVEIYGDMRERLSRYTDYDHLLHRRGFVGGVAIDSLNILSLKERAFAPSLQQRAMDHLGCSITDSTSHAVVEAMVVGSRRMMPATLREAYARTGLMHLLAVSGLHLGIVAMVVGLLLMPLHFVHHGHRLANVLTIVAIWLFAATSGMPPSVVRAATMLSIVQLSLLTSSRRSTLNALCATIFLMLLFRPDYLYDPSFELSALAVMGIALWGLPLFSVIPRKAKFLRFIIPTLAIGLSATLWTLPIISYTFGNIPLASVILTPLVMLFAYVIVGGGIISLILPTMLASYVVMVAEGAAWAQNTIVNYFASLPYICIEYTMSRVEVAICYTIYIAITLLAWSINRKKVVPLYYVNTL